MAGVLTPNLVSETVQVTASVPLLNTENAMRGDPVASREMTDIPLDGRDFAADHSPHSSPGPPGEVPQSCPVEDPVVHPAVPAKLEISRPY